MINSQELMWQRTTLLSDKAVQFATAKTYVFSDSVLSIQIPSKHGKEKIDLIGL